MKHQLKLYLLLQYFGKIIYYIFMRIDSLDIKVNFGERSKQNNQISFKCPYNKEETILMIYLKLFQYYFLMKDFVYVSNMKLKIVVKNLKTIKKFMNILIQ